MKVIISLTSVLMIILIIIIFVILGAINKKVFYLYENRYLWTALVNVATSALALISFLIKPIIYRFIYKIFYIFGLKKFCLSTIKNLPIQSSYTRHDIELDTASHNIYRIYISPVCSGEQKN
jgi:hypothetical protein